MTPNKLRQSYFDFMRGKGATIVPSASLLPENDPTTLFTGAGMQPMIPYLLGETHPAGNDIANTQKCVRTGDIEETGDNSHLTFFEMIGRWELGGDPVDYKRKQIEYIWEWQVEELGLDPNHLYISVFQGNKDLGIPRDDEAIEIWCTLFRSKGIEPIIEDNPQKYGSSRNGRIFVYDEKENWWSRAGVPSNMPVGEPGGPDSEMFYDFDPDGDEMDHPATDSARFLEIGNNVFMAYKREENGFRALERPNIDYGGGLERLCAAIAGDNDLYKTPFFDQACQRLEQLSGKSYDAETRNFRIILDHSRAATFLIGDGAVPSNVDAGYITRRLIRRAIRVARKLDLTETFMSELAKIYIDEAAAYPELAQHKDKILKAIEDEEAKFSKTIQNGERELQNHLQKHGQVTGKEAFFFYETYGFPLELTEEFLKENKAELAEREGFEAAAKAHSEKSRTASAGKFAGGLAEHSEKTTAFHSATHLLLAGLQKVLGPHVHQMGSNITNDRTRFDFSHGEKMTPEQKQEVEAYVNAAITANAQMTVDEMPKDQARAEGVEGSFWEKYPEIVKVYVFEDAQGRTWSKELCGGPHVDNTSDIAKFGRFKIKKEESSSAGVRRIKAVFKEGQSAARS